jgi:hypothetical protein
MYYLAMFLTMYVCMYVCVHIRMYGCMHLSTYLPTYLPACLPTYLSTRVRAGALLDPQQENICIIGSLAFTHALPILALSRWSRWHTL